MYVVVREKQRAERLGGCGASSRVTITGQPPFDYVQRPSEGRGPAQPAARGAALSKRVSHDNFFDGDFAFCGLAIDHHPRT